MFAGMHPTLRPGDELVFDIVKTKPAVSGSDSVNKIEDLLPI